METQQNSDALKKGLCAGHAICFFVCEMHREGIHRKRRLLGTSRRLVWLGRRMLGSTKIESIQRESRKLGRDVICVLDAWTSKICVVHARVSTSSISKMRKSRSSCFCVLCCVFILNRRMYTGWQWSKTHQYRWPSRIDISHVGFDMPLINSLATS